MSTAATGGGGSGFPDVLGMVAIYGVAAVILSSGILMLALIVVLAKRAGPRAVPAPAGATVSPDGLYWWDGASWRPTS